MSRASLSAPSRNVEIKARLNNLEHARTIALDLCGGISALLIQTDTYFRSRHGRLKLREIAEQSTQLIWYDRPNERETRTSHYRIVEIADATAVRALLEAACGVSVVVAKRREFYLYRHVRIHLDQVGELGDFIEFEAVLPSGADLDSERAIVAQLAEQFGIQQSELIGVSYSDLLLAAKGTLPESRTSRADS